MTTDVQSLMTPDVASRWEFALTEAGYDLRYDRVLPCPGCGGAHVRVFFETEWDDTQDEFPVRAVVITVMQHEEGVMIFTDHFENGERQVRIVFQTDDIGTFFETAANDVAEGLRALRRVSLYAKPKSPHELAVACLN